MLAVTLVTSWFVVVGVALAKAPSRQVAIAAHRGSDTVAYRYRGRTAEEWAARFRQRTRQLQNARRTLRSDSNVVEAINLACVVYGNCSTLWRKAGCETGGTYSPNSHNTSGASGLFQFLPSTFASTPYARFSIWSPYANALAAGWMHKVGRGGEWSCR